MIPFEDLDQEQKDAFAEFIQMFSRNTSQILADYINNKKNLTELSRYSIKELVEMLKSPATEHNQTRIRKLSQFLYQVSSHYKTLVNYYPNIPLYQYTITPSFILKDLNEEAYKERYIAAINQVEKYNLPYLAKKIIKIAIRDGAFYGICFESDDTFTITPFNPDYAKITSIENGTLRFSIDLEYFSGRRNFLLESYPQDIQQAYIAYKGNSNQDIKGNNKLRYYEPVDGICIMADDNDPSIVLPLFTGLLKDVFDIEDYRLIKKSNNENTNYKAVSMKIETDPNTGIPRLNNNLIRKYYNMICNNVPEGVGVILSPFKAETLSFTGGRNHETVELADAESQFWFDSGTSPLLFGSQKATTSGALSMGVKPNEAMAFQILQHIESFFNSLLNKSIENNIFKIRFTQATIFNIEELTNRHFKAASYGVGGAKLLYAADLGLSPTDIMGMSFLEDNILNLTKDRWHTPLISSNVQSSLDTSGRPTKEEEGKTLSDEGERTREKQ